MDRKPDLGQRATFMMMFVGIAKDYGYTKKDLLNDVRLSWSFVKSLDEKRKLRGASKGQKQQHRISRVRRRGARGDLL